MHVAEAKRRTGSAISWICDTMDNSIKHALGSPPNGEFVIDPKGKIVRKRFWSNPRTLRNDLQELVGPVDNPTKISDLAVEFKAEPRPIASGVVPRPKLPRLSPIQLKPLTDGKPSTFFVKLRAEAEPALLGKKAEGKLYLGFHLDPLYKVHWNNRAGRVEVEIKAPSGMELAQRELQGPEVEADADVDPREFLIDVKAIGKDKSFEVTVRYMACDDAKTFCLPVTQRYQAILKRDRDGGSRPGTFMPAMFANTAQLDKNKDGKITADELPKGRVTLYLGHMDLNDDGHIDQRELRVFNKMFNNGRGFEKPPR